MTSTSIPEYTDYLVTLLEGGSLGLTDVYYGDQTNIPRTPSACVDSGEKGRELNGAPRRMMVTLEVYILIYHFKVDSAESNQRNADLLAEATEDLVHQDAKMGDRAIHSFVKRVESGYAVRGRDTFRASRMTVEIMQQEQLPSSV